MGRGIEVKEEKSERENQEGEVAGDDGEKVMKKGIKAGLIRNRP